MIKGNSVAYMTIAALLLLNVWVPLSEFAQSSESDSQDDTRGIWDTGLRQKRPGASRKQVKYRRVIHPGTATPATAPPADQSEDAIIGITIWRLRPSTEADVKETRMLEHQAGSGPGIQLTAERVEANTLFPKGDRLRLTVESPREGYLYVIDREQYADGGLGEPELIFPTLNTRGGDNKVRAGLVVEIPDQSDNPPFFRVNPRRAGLVSDQLTFIVTQKPLEGLSIGHEALKLTDRQVVDWQKKWAAKTEQIESKDGVGQVYTKSEKDAGTNGTRMLTQDDPLPQTIYHAVIKRGEPLLVVVPLRYKM